MKIFRALYSKITNTLFKRKMSKIYTTLDSHTALQLLVHQLKPLLHLFFRENLPAATVRARRPASHTIPLRRDRSTPATIVRRARASLLQKTCCTPGSRVEGETKRVVFRQMSEFGSLVKPTHVTDACTSGPSMYEVGTVLV